MLHYLRRWEYRWLRKVFCFRWHGHEGRMAFAKRTARILEQWFNQHAFVCLHQKVLLAVFKQPWREKIVPVPGGGPGIKELREARNRRWWDGLRHLPTRYKDAAERHNGPGNVTVWEDVLFLPSVNIGKISSKLRKALRFGWAGPFNL